MDKILRLEHIQKYYGNQGNLTKAIDDISFSVHAGEFVGIMGASGSGKTTMLNCISTIDTVSAGHIFLDGTDVTEIREKELARFRRENLGFVFQDFNLLDTLTIAENIALALTINKVPAGQIDGQVREMAGRLNILDILDKYPYQVSGGQKQRCACARAIIHHPKLLLADEPTGALDSHSAQMLLSTLQSINERMGATILLVTHDAFTASYAGRILFLQDGRIFTELRKGSDSRSVFFDKILNVLTMIGGGQAHVCQARLEKRKAVRKRLSDLYRDHNDLRHALLFVPVHIQPLLSAGYWQRIRFYDLSDSMKAAICAITLLLLFLIRFVNRYMLRRKQKEFALQAIMGMEQRLIGRLFLAETFGMGLLSITMGIALGVSCSQFITAMLLTAYGKSYALSWMLFPDTAALTVGFFVLSFLAVGLFNTRTIRKTKIIDMLAAERKNDPELKKSRWIVLPAILFELFTIWMLVTGVRKVWFYYDRRFAMPVQIMFWGNIALPAVTLLFSGWQLIRRKRAGLSRLVCGLMLCAVLNTCTAASVPALIDRYYLPLGAGTVNQYLLFILVDLIFFICTLIYLASSFLAAWKERSPEHRYKGENLFFFGQIISKLDTTSKTMTRISVTLVLAIFLFIAAPILTGWASGYLEIRSMYDVQISSRYNNVYDEEELPRGDYAVVTGYLAAHGVETDYDCTFDLYLPKEEGFSQAGQV